MCKISAKRGDIVAEGNNSTKNKPNWSWHCLPVNATCQRLSQERLSQVMPNLGTLKTVNPYLKIIKNQNKITKGLEILAI